MVESNLDQVFHALADPTRRALLQQLMDGEQTVGSLAEPHQMSLAGVSKHLQTLERARLIRRDKRGREHFCRLNPRPLARARDWLGFYREFWTERLDALEDFLDKEGKQ